MKTSFLLHLDSLDVLDALTPEQCGHLFMAMRDYNLTGSMPDDPMIKLALMPFLNQWKRDLVRFDKVCERNRANGMKGGRPKNPLGFLGTQENPQEPKKAERENEKEKENEKERESIKSTRFASPTLDEVKEFFKENGYTTEAATKAFTYYNEAQWRDSRGHTVKNWKQKMRGVWFRDEHKHQAPQPYNPRAGTVPTIYTSPENYRPV
jgi:hypothetical protein